MGSRAYHEVPPPFFWWMGSCRHPQAPQPLSSLLTPCCSSLAPVRACWPLVYDCRPIILVLLVLLLLLLLLALALAIILLVILFAVTVHCQCMLDGGRGGAHWLIPPPSSVGRVCVSVHSFAIALALACTRLPLFVRARAH